MWKLFRGFFIMPDKIEKVQIVKLLWFGLSSWTSVASFASIWCENVFTNLKSTILEIFKMVTKKMFEKKMKNLLLVQMVWRFFGWTPFDHGLLICVYLESGDLSRMEAYADSYGLSLEWRPSFSCWKALNKKRRRTKKQGRRTDDATSPSFSLVFLLLVF